MATSVAPSEPGPGIWKKLWNDLRTSSNDSRKLNKTLLILANSSQLHTQIITRLQSIDTAKTSTTLFSSSKKIQEKQQIAEGIGLDYTFLEIALESEFTTNVTIDIYTFTYNDITDHKLMKQFLTRFNKKQDLTVLNILDLENYTNDNSFIFSLEKVFKDNSCICQILNQIFTNESNNTSVVDEFKRNAAIFNEVITTAVTMEPSELGRGECDYPIGVDYVLFVVGSEALSSLALTTLTQAEIDKLQQLLRLLVLKTGGSLYFFPNLIDEDLNVKNSIKSFKRTLLNRTSKLSPQVDDYLSLLIPRGWDSWGKIRVLNEAFDFEHWNDLWLKLISEQTQVPEKENVASNDSTAVVDYYQQYQIFLKAHYKTQLESEIAVSSTSPNKTASPKNEFANSTIILDEPDISSTSFQETHSVLHDFRQQFLENDLDILSNLQSTPGVSRFQDTVPMGSNAAKFKDFFNDLLSKEGNNGSAADGDEILT